MAKNSKNRDSARHQNFTLPEIHHIDDLAVMPDEELSSAYHALDSMREKVNAAKADPTAWEIEICYVRREQLQRRARREAHDSYLRANSYAGEDETALPTADFDNSHFMVN